MQNGECMRVCVLCALDSQTSMRETVPAGSDGQFACTCERVGSASVVCTCSKLLSRSVAVAFPQCSSESTSLRCVNVGINSCGVKQHPLIFSKRPKLFQFSPFRLFQPTIYTALNAIESNRASSFGEDQCLRKEEYNGGGSLPGSRSPSSSGGCIVLNGEGHCDRLGFCQRCDYSSTNICVELESLRRRYPNNCADIMPVRASNIPVYQRRHSRESAHSIGSSNRSDNGESFSQESVRTDCHQSKRSDITTVKDAKLGKYSYTSLPRGRNEYCSSALYSRSQSVDRTVASRVSCHKSGTSKHSNNVSELNSSRCRSNISLDENRESNSTSESVSIKNGTIASSHTPRRSGVSGIPRPRYYAAAKSSNNNSMYSKQTLSREFFPGERCDRDSRIMCNSECRDMKTTEKSLKSSCTDPLNGTQIVNTDISTASLENPICDNSIDHLVPKKLSGRSRNYLLKKTDPVKTSNVESKHDSLPKNKLISYCLRSWYDSLPRDPFKVLGNNDEFIEDDPLNLIPSISSTINYFDSKSDIKDERNENTSSFNGNKDAPINCQNQLNDSKDKTALTNVFLCADTSTKFKATNKMEDLESNVVVTGAGENKNHKCSKIIDKASCGVELPMESSSIASNSQQSTDSVDVRPLHQKLMGSFESHVQDRDPSIADITALSVDHFGSNRVHLSFDIDEQFLDRRFDSIVDKLKQVASKLRSSKLEEGYSLRIDMNEQLDTSDEPIYAEITSLENPNQAEHIYNEIPDLYADEDSVRSSWNYVTYPNSSHLHIAHENAEGRMNALKLHSRKLYQLKRKNGIRRKSTPGSVNKSIENPGCELSKEAIHIGNKLKRATSDGMNITSIAEIPETNSDCPPTLVNFQRIQKEANGNIPKLKRPLVRSLSDKGSPRFRIHDKVNWRSKPWSDMESRCPSNSMNCELSEVPRTLSILLDNGVKSCRSDSIPDSCSSLGGPPPLVRPYSLTADGSRDIITNDSINCSNNQSSLPRTKKDWRLSDINRLIRDKWRSRKHIGVRSSPQPSRQQRLQQHVDSVTLDQFIDSLYRQRFAVDSDLSESSVSGVWAPDSVLQRQQEQNDIKCDTSSSSGRLNTADQMLPRAKYSQEVKENEIEAFANRHRSMSLPRSFLAERYRVSGVKSAIPSVLFPWRRKSTVVSSAASTLLENCTSGQSDASRGFPEHASSIYPECSSDSASAEITLSNSSVAPSSAEGHNQRRCMSGERETSMTSSSMSGCEADSARSSVLTATTVAVHVHSASDYSGECGRTEGPCSESVGRSSSSSGCGDELEPALQTDMRRHVNRRLVSDSTCLSDSQSLSSRQHRSSVSDCDWISDASSVSSRFDSGYRHLPADSVNKLPSQFKTECRLACGGDDRDRPLTADHYSDAITSLSRSQLYPLSHQFRKQQPSLEPTISNRKMFRSRHRAGGMRRSFSEPLVAAGFHHTCADRTPRSQRRVVSACSQDCLLAQRGVDPATNNSANTRQGVSGDMAQVLCHCEGTDDDQLTLYCGDVVHVLDRSQSHRWFGTCRGKSGWFPSSFVRLCVGRSRVSSGVVGSVYPGQSHGLTGSFQPGQSHDLAGSAEDSGLSELDQIRSKVVAEIVQSEQTFLQDLEHIVHGYLRQVERRPDLFCREQTTTLFGNVEQLLSFQCDFVQRLTACVNTECLHTSRLGRVFVDNHHRFSIYAAYCNNHPAASSLLHQLCSEDRYRHFFEACRLLRNTATEIGLDGFLLTPVQKICRYPLQLGELLKVTAPGHGDRDGVTRALAAMRSAAVRVNEAQRRMESVQQLVAWQAAVDGWTGLDLVETSTVMIHQADVTKLTSHSWGREVCTLFLFDHLLVYCRRDLLKRNSFQFRGRIDLDSAQVIDIGDGKDELSGASVRNAVRITSPQNNKWYIFCCKTEEDKLRWLLKFREERMRSCVRSDGAMLPRDRWRYMASCTAKNSTNSRPKKSISAWFAFGNGKNMVRI